MPEPSPLSRAQVRELDRRAAEELGLSGLVLMENAGRAVAELVLARLRVDALAGRRGPPPWRIAIACGRGNNGGDGYVAARHLHEQGQEVEVDSTASAGELSGDAAAARTVVERIGIAVRDFADGGELALAVERWRRCDALVDALLGTGASGAPRGAVARAIEALNSLAGPLKIAVDLPSGLDADTGGAPGACFVADATVTFVAPKLGFESQTARAHLGAVVVAGIGVGPRSLPPRVAET
jgi:NAD(P)H-hydrate epimerase